MHGDMCERPIQLTADGAPPWCGISSREERRRGPLAGGAADWNDNPLLDGDRAALAGTALCDERTPYRGFIHSVLGDLEYFASLGMPYPGDDRFCWLCTADKDTNPWNNFSDVGDPSVVRQDIDVRLQ